jgi:hypothetical protein
MGVEHVKFQRFGSVRDKMRARTIFIQPHSLQAGLF